MMNIWLRGFWPMVFAILPLLFVVIVGCPKKDELVSEPETAAVSEPAGAEKSQADKKKELKEAEARRLEEERARQLEVEKARRLESDRVEKLRIEFENVDIHFEYDKFSLTPEARNILRKKYEYLGNHSGVAILIEGHCDERGTIEYNVALGDRRAKSARDYLIRLGVEPARIETISYGEEMALDARHIEEAWARNRRDKFVIIHVD